MYTILSGKKKKEEKKERQRKRKERERKRKKEKEKEKKKKRKIEEYMGGKKEMKQENAGYTSFQWLPAICARRCTKLR